MDLATYRNSRGLSQAEVAAELGLQSKASISMIETGFRRATIPVAMQIAVWSKGQVRALDLVSPEDAQLIAAWRDAERDVAVPEVAA